MPTSSARSSRRAGYTLAELLVVLVIIGLTLALVAPRLFFTSDGAKLDRAVRSFDTAARAARANARLRGHDVLLTVHLDNGVFRIEPDGPVYELPGDPVLRRLVRIVFRDTSMGANQYQPGKALCKAKDPQGGFHEIGLFFRSKPYLRDPVHTPAHRPLMNPVVLT